MVRINLYTVTIWSRKLSLQISSKEEQLAGSVAYGLTALFIQSMSARLKSPQRTMMAFFKIESTCKSDSEDERSWRMLLDDLGGR